MKKINVTLNEERKRFEVDLGPDTGYAAYITEGNDLSIINIYVPEEYRQEGYGSALMEAALLYASEQNLTLVPLDSFAKRYLARKTEV